MYVRFPLSLRNIEDLLFERGFAISYETIRYWWNRFGPEFASGQRRQHLQHGGHCHHIGYAVLLNCRQHLGRIKLPLNDVCATTPQPDVCAQCPANMKHWKDIQWNTLRVKPCKLAEISERHTQIAMCDFRSLGPASGVRSIDLHRRIVRMRLEPGICRILTCHPFGELLALAPQLSKLSDREGV